MPVSLVDDYSPLPLEEFLIPPGGGTTALRCCRRVPADPTRRLEKFTVELTDCQLSATADVWAGYTHSAPVCLFEEMAERWTGWKDRLTWQSLEGELKLECSHDGLGHIQVRVTLWSGCMPFDWKAEVTVNTEAGQLDKLARDARRFFGG